MGLQNGILVRPPVGRAFDSHRYTARKLTTRRRECGPVRTWAIFDERDLYCHAETRPSSWRVSQRDLLREPRRVGGVLSKLAFAGAFARLLAGLLCLLPRVLARLLTLLTRGQIAGPADPACYFAHPAAAGPCCPDSCKSPKLPKYNLNAHPSN